MKSNRQEFEFESRRLGQTINLVNQQLNQAGQESERASKDIASLQEEMRDNASHSVANLWDSQNFEDLVALSQYTWQIAQKASVCDNLENRMAKLEKMLGSPYFARIDFKFDGENAFEKVYVGRASLWDEDADEVYVYDWRSPIASVFYRHGTGPAHYDAPVGRLTGEVKLKRQYEIKDGILEYYFDADVQVIDEFLRKLLSKNTSPKMKSIVETIQKEQDVVIRDMENDLLMIQGVAGSGKTSIALHRAAYLMYQGLSAKLSAESIMIVSPNSLFERYIANVLPELGEDNVISMVFEEMLAAVLKFKHVQTRNQYLEAMITNKTLRGTMKSSLEFKASKEFSAVLGRLAREFPQQPSKEQYVKLFSDEGYFRSMSKDLELPCNIAEILKFTQENLRSKKLFYDDAAALAFIKLKQKDIDAYKAIKQVVVDEAQDYYPLHFEIFKLLFPNAKYTVLGDINQSLEKRGSMRLYDEIAEILHKKKATLVTMDKSFRCTNEILNFSSMFTAQSIKIKSFNRSGLEPEIHVAESPESLCTMIAKEAAACIGEGLQSVGLICKSEKNSISIYRRLAGMMDVTLATNESSGELKGVFVIPVCLSKGLEFDAVLICDANAANYSSEDDKKLLYVACTRALHKLALFCEGEASPLLLIEPRRAHDGRGADAL